MATDMGTGMATETTRKRRNKEFLMLHFSLKKRLSKTELLMGMTDVHAHLLPGVDDGVKNLEEAQVVIKFLEQIGVRKIILTPHVMEDYPENNASYLKQRFAEFTGNIGSEIHFSLAAEYMLDASFSQHLNENVLLLGSNRLLVETSYLSGPPNLKNILYDLSLKGYVPVIAHPERYLYLPKEAIEELASLGYELQLNLPSLAGIYGKEVKKRAEFFLSKELYTYLGSDFHRLSLYQHCIEKIELNGKQIKQLKKLLTNNEKIS